jgi:hypothetical protein
MRSSRPPVSALLAEVEGSVGLAVSFRNMPPGAHVLAAYQFVPPCHAVVTLAPGWQDVEVAHELLHMKLELVDGHPVFAFARPLSKSELEAANLIHSYTDDELVHAGLAQRGFRVDGEVVRPAFFDDVCTNVPAALRAGNPRAYDGMVHLDSLGRGVLRRAAFYFLASRLRQAFGAGLGPSRVAQIDELLTAFRESRPVEVAYAERVLQLFETNDIRTAAGHAAILSGWAGLEGLGSVVTTATYRRQPQGFVLAV